MTDIWDKFKCKSLKEKTKEDVLNRINWPEEFNEDGRLFAAPSTPILTNYNTKEGNIYACAILEMQDNKKELIELFEWVTKLSSNGAGISISFDNVRPAGCKVGSVNYTVEGILPFLSLFESSINAFKQGNRAGAGVAWLSIDNCEILNFIRARYSSSEGGPMKNHLNSVHIGVVITEEFMQAYKEGKKIKLKLPQHYKEKYGDDIEHINTLEVEVDARELLTQIVKIRLERGEPFLMFKRNVKNDDVKCPNLCTEVLLPTNKDKRIALCCLASIDLYQLYSEWENEKDFNEELCECVWKIIDYLEEIRKDKRYNKTKPYSEGQTLDIGIGFSGIVDLYNYFVGTYGIDQGVCMFLEIINSVKETVDMVKEDRLHYTFAIAPNVNVSQLLSDASPGIMPRLDVTSVSKSQETRETICRVYDLAREENKKHLIYINAGKEALERHYEHIVKPLIDIIDQGISYTLVSEPTTTIQYELDRLEKLYDDGVKTVYYHKTVEDSKLMKTSSNTGKKSLSSILNECNDERECTLCQN